MKGIEQMLNELHLGESLQQVYGPVYMLLLVFAENIFKIGKP